ncbi:MAG: hypothetical protein FWE35_12595 [Streptosporangiales bacterium]|nr:hypothetical protein [Streptosporangiales bacterium]
MSLVRVAGVGRDRREVRDRRAWCRVETLDEALEAEHALQRLGPVPGGRLAAAP